MLREVNVVLARERLSHSKTCWAKELGICFGERVSILTCEVLHQTCWNASEGSFCIRANSDGSVWLVALGFLFLLLHFLCLLVISMYKTFEVCLIWLSIPLVFRKKCSSSYKLRLLMKWSVIEVDLKCLKSSSKHLRAEKFKKKKKLRSFTS